MCHPSVQGVGGGPPSQDRNRASNEYSFNLLSPFCSCSMPCVAAGCSFPGACCCCCFCLLGPGRGACGEVTSFPGACFCCFCLLGPGRGACGEVAHVLPWRLLLPAAAAFACWGRGGVRVVRWPTCVNIYTHSQTPLMSTNTIKMCQVGFH